MRGVTAQTHDIKFVRIIAMPLLIVGIEVLFSLPKSPCVETVQLDSTAVPFLAIGLELSMNRSFGDTGFGLAEVYPRYDIQQHRCRLRDGDRLLTVHCLRGSNRGSADNVSS